MLLNHGSSHSAGTATVLNNCPGKMISFKLTSVDIGLQLFHKYCTKSVPSSLEKSNFISLQTQLDTLYIKKAKGAYIHSEAQWIKEGEKSTSYFCRLEKRLQSKNFQ